MSQYVYLSLVLTEHLVNTMMAKHVSKSANRALRLVVSKFKALEGLPYNSLTKLYDAVVWSMGKDHIRRITRQWGQWSRTDVKQWDSVLNHWYRLRSMDESRINFKVFKWAVECGNNRYKNWCFRLQQQFGQCNIANIFFNRSTDLVAEDYV